MGIRSRCSLLLGLALTPSGNGASTAGYARR
jgi:hypothetical protein